MKKKKKTPMGRTISDEEILVAYKIGKITLDEAIRILKAPIL